MTDDTDLNPAAPAPPQQKNGPLPEHPHHLLWHGVRRALFAAPALFKTGLKISGVRATDIFSLNSSLGASIENSIVDILNDLRDIWDPPDDKGIRHYRDASFVRQSQTWPDVLLKSGNANEQPLMGIELKGWFILSKEGEPSFRYKVNPQVCTEMDLLAVYPWILDEVISGSPKLFSPFIAEARWAAEMRNHYWLHARAAKGNVSITPAAHTAPYPRSGHKFLDVATADGGGNFGRASRAGIMNAFITDVFENQVSGIPVRAWHQFFASFRDSADLNKIMTELRRRRAANLSQSATDHDDLTNLYALMLDYIDRHTGHSAAESAIVPSSKTTLSVLVPVDALTLALNAAPGPVEPIAIRTGTLEIPVLASVQALRTSLGLLVKAGISTARLDIADKNGALHIEVCRKP